MTREVCKLPLTHVNSDSVEASYSYKDLFEHRHRLL